MVTSSEMIEPVKEPRSPEPAATPDRATKSFLSEVVVLSRLAEPLSSRLVSKACRAALTSTPSPMVPPVNVPRSVSSFATPVKVAMLST